MHKKLMAKIISCSILFLYASFSIAGEELALAIESSSHRGLNKDVIAAILDYCNMPTYNNILKSCKTIYDTFDVALVTKKNVNQIYFGIDRIIAKYPNACHTLPDDCYLNGLIFYANHEDLNRGPAIFNMLLNNASESHKTIHQILLSFFNEDGKDNCIGIYQGKYHLCEHYINAAIVKPHAVENGHYLLPFIASIYHTSNNLKNHQYNVLGYCTYTTLDLLFNLAVLTEIPTLAQKLLNIDNTLVNNACVLLLPTNKRT
jgi:hypothetical protein